MFREPEMNHKNTSPLPPLTILFFSLFLLMASSALGQGPGMQPMEAPVEVAPVIEKEISARITLIGTVEAYVSTMIASQEPGLAKEIKVEEGDRVKKGQLLAVLDSTGLGLSLKASQAELREAEIQYQQAKRDLERYQALIAKDIVAKQKFEEVRLRQEQAAQKIKRLQALTAELSDRLNKTRVYSPVSGYVVQKNAQVGEWIKEGGAVATIAVVNLVKVVVPLPEIYVRRISSGQKVSITFDALPGQTYQGQVIAVVPEADPRARTFPVKISVSNPQNKIKVGMLARATFPIGERRRAVLVPKDAIVLSDTGNLVYTVISGKAVPVPIKFGLAYDGFVEVAQGLRAGQLVVVRGNERLMPGTKVRILTSPSRKNRQ